ncbi:MAG TPA: hypothetical protein VLG76_05455 [Rhabdochlamydiaceae bacterium]|nr:hypothetical protein [Rhabdochlamydiaceae bacterium]
MGAFPHYEQMIWVFLPHLVYPAILLLFLFLILFFYPVYPAILLLCLNLVDPAAFWKQ